MSEPIQFDRAEYVDASALVCKLCRQPLEYQYYDFGGATICASCRERVEQGRSAGARSHRFVRSAGFGFAAATVGAVIYALIVHLTGIEFGLMAVVLGYGVGRSVSAGSYHRGGGGYQALAMSLTYVAICVGYVPQILHSAGSFHPALVIALSFVISLAAPFLILFQHGVSGILGLFIIGIGLFEAWKLNRRGVREVAGPFPIAAPRNGSSIIAG